MARYKYHYAPYPITVFSATSEATGYPKERLVSLLRLNRPWRSTSTAQQFFVFDLGSTKSIGAIIIHRCNFTSVSFGHGSSSGGPFTPITGNPFTVVQDLKDGFYKLIVQPSGVSNRYVDMIIPNQGTTDNNDYFQLGAILISSALTEIAANPQNPNDEERIEHTLKAQIGADEEVKEIGLPQVQLTWRALLGQTDLNEWRTLRNLGPSTPVVWWLGGSTADVYVMKRVGGVRISDNDAISEVASTWRQVR